ncbi:hypothetical protein A2U01_0083970, partial [Trifolium medium]|nr:hypothetical protein [Trifolium medium]
MEAERDGTAV